MKDKNNISCKVVLVGDPGVGKTSIIERYINNKYEENQKTTLVSSYTFKKLDIKKYNKSVSLDIWDTAGQEVYRSLSKNFYINASIGILVYDITRKNSFDSIKDYWLEQLKTFGEEKMILTTPLFFHFFLTFIIYNYFIFIFFTSLCIDQFISF